MFQASNSRHFISSARFTFVVLKTGTRFEINVKPIAEGGMRGLKVTTASGAKPMPDGAKINPGIGPDFRPGDPESVIYKGGNGAMFVDVDGEEYDLFKVVLVDPGNDGATMSNEGGAVIHFKTIDAIPPELGGEGVLKENPFRDLENG